MKTRTKIVIAAVLTVLGLLVIDRTHRDVHDLLTAGEWHDLEEWT